MEDDVKWMSVHEPLTGLLSVKVDESDVFPHRKMASSAWLVVHLHLVKRDIAAKIHAALEAIKELFFMAEQVRFSSTKTTALFQRVLASQMMVTPLREDGSTTWCFTQQLQYHPVQILFDYRGMQITDSNLLTPLRSTLFQSRRAEESHQMTVGLCLRRCRLSPETIASLDNLLSERDQTHEALVAPALGRLDLSDAGLTPPILQTVAVLLRRHDVLDIRLENAFARAALPETIEAMASVLHSVFSPPNPRQAVRFSLSQNSLDARYFEALASALQNATRPLRSLGLAQTLSISDPVDREQCWYWLASIMQASGDPLDGDDEGECELDWSANRIHRGDTRRFDEAFQTLAMENADHVRQVLLASGAQVTCRVKTHTVGYVAPGGPERADDELLHTATFYEIVEARADGWYRISDPSAPTGQVSWIRSVSVRELVSSDQPTCQRRARFTSLKLSNVGAETRFDPSVVRWLWSAGSNLRKLSLDGIAGVDHTIVSRLHLICPLLTHLTCINCRMFSATAICDAIRNDTHRRLISVNMSDNAIGFEGATMVADLFRELPDLPVRHLAVKRNDMGAFGLTSLGQILRENQTLEVIELDKNDTDFAYARQQIYERHNGELLGRVPVPLASKLAFLSVLAVLEPLRAIDTPVVSLVLEFAAKRITRHLLWER